MILSSIIKYQNSGFHVSLENRPCALHGTGFRSPAPVVSFIDIFLLPEQIAPSPQPPLGFHILIPPSEEFASIQIFTKFLACPSRVGPQAAGVDMFSIGFCSNSNAPVSNFDSIFSIVVVECSLWS